MMTVDTAVRGAYFSDASHHSPLAADIEAASIRDGALMLRARTLLHLLFAEQLVIGDSPALNNRAFRALVWADEAVPDCPNDFAELLKARRLVIAKRAHRSFEELRNDQQQDNVLHVPSPAYAAYMDQVAERAILPWTFDDVAHTFRGGVVEQLTQFTGSPEMHGPAAARTLDWIGRNDPLLFNEFRKWADTPASGLTAADRDFIDRFIGIQYTLSLPRALQLDYVGPADRNSPFGAIRMGRLEELIDTRAGAAPDYRSDDCYVINPLILGKMPAAVLLEVLQLPERAEFLRQITRLRSGWTGDWTMISESCRAMMQALNAVALQWLRGHRLEDTLAELRSVRPRFRLTLSVDTLVSEAVDLVISVVRGDTALDDLLVKIGVLSTLTLGQDSRAAHTERFSAAIHDRERHRYDQLAGASDAEKLVWSPRRRMRRFVADPNRIQDGDL